MRNSKVMVDPSSGNQHREPSEPEPQRKSYSVQMDTLRLQ